MGVRAGALDTSRTSRHRSQAAGIIRGTARPEQLRGRAHTHPKRGNSGRPGSTWRAYACHGGDNRAQHLRAPAYCLDMNTLTVEAEEQRFFQL